MCNKVCNIVSICVSDRKDIILNIYFAIRRLLKYTSQMHTIYLIYILYYIDIKYIVWIWLVYVKRRLIYQNARNGKLKNKHFASAFSPRTGVMGHQHIAADKRFECVTGGC
jgi:hypothetical protein